MSFQIQVDQRIARAQAAANAAQADATTALGATGADLTLINNAQNAADAAQSAAGGAQRSADNAQASINGLVGSAIWDPASLALGAEELKTIAVAGVALGDFVLVSVDVDLPAGIILSAYVSNVDEVTAKISNFAATNPYDMASTTVAVRVL